MRRSATRDGPSTRRPAWLVLVAVSLPMFMATLDNLVVTNALPVIRRDLGASIEELAWFINAYTLSFASLILFVSALADRWGRRRVFLWGIATFTLASFLCGLAGEPWMLIGARAIQGAGAAALLPLSLTLLSTSVSDRVRPAAIGIWGGVSGLGVAVGPLIGGAVVEGLSWQAIFWLNIPIGALCLPLVRYAIGEAFGRAQRFDVAGVVLAAAGVFTVTYAIVRGNDAGWLTWEIIGTFGAGTLLLAGFVLTESRVEAPILPLRLFRNRSFSAANVIGFVFSFGIFGAIFILIQFLQIVQGVGPLEAGVMTMPWTLAPLVVAPLTGLITPRTGHRPVIVAGNTLMAAGLFWIAVVLTPDLEYVTLIGPFLLAGIGMGLIFSPIAAATLHGMAPVDQATASGTNSTAREVGVALGIATLTAVFTANGGELSPQGYTDAAVPALFTGAGALVLAGVAGFLVPPRGAAVSAAAATGR